MPFLVLVGFAEGDYWRVAIEVNHVGNDGELDLFGGFLWAGPDVVLAERVGLDADTGGAVAVHLVPVLVQRVQGFFGRVGPDDVTVLNVGGTRSKTARNRVPQLLHRYMPTAIQYSQKQVGYVLSTILSPCQSPKGIKSLWFWAISSTNVYRPSRKSGISMSPR